RNRWVESPDRMLFPVLTGMLSRRFETVLKAPAVADMRLDTDIVLLRQEFTGDSSRIHLVLRVQLNRGGRIFSKEFEAFENCSENDPYGGAIAANKAVSKLVSEISEFCAEHAY
ncbi:MAG TPA: ABC-type transport auxiliary lipoprotein family protein, partial [Burkholderiales bacterium]|nr:ABC-type transport auxiliary lipoprotein family protein [Burkholderiales bacterium]